MVQQQDRKLEELDSINQIAKQQEYNPSLSIGNQARREIPRTVFGYEGKYYPATWRFFHKPITLRYTKEFSATDETNPVMLYNAMTDFVKNTLIIVDYIDDKEFIISSDSLYEHDRLAYILAVHRNTKGITDAITFSYVCPECKTDNKAILVPENMKYIKPDPFIDRFYNAATQGPVTLKLADNTEIKTKPITIKSALSLQQFLRRRQQEQKDVSQLFLNMFSILHCNIDHTSIDDLYSKFIRLDGDPELYEKLFQASKRANFNITNEVVHQCACRFHKEAQYSINGITSIFLNRNISDLFA